MLFSLDCPPYPVQKNLNMSHQISATVCKGSGQEADPVPRIFIWRFVTFDTIEQQITEETPSVAAFARFRLVELCAEAFYLQKLQRESTDFPSSWAFCLGLSIWGKRTSFGPIHGSTLRTSKRKGRDWATNINGIQARRSPKA